MSVQGRRGFHHSASSMWDTIRYALDSNARTLRLCMIVVVASIPSILFAVLVAH